LGWLDLPALLRFRKQVLSLDSTLLLTHGNPLGPFAVLAYLNPVQGVYTGVCSNGKGKPPLFGQIRYAMGARCARLAFVMPVDGLNSITLPSLIEHLTIQAGVWGAMHFLAEVDGQNTAFEGLRRAGFSVYDWQRIWRFPGTGMPEGYQTQGTWQSAGEADGIAIRGLYQSLVPALVQPMEGLFEKRLQGLVCRRNGELLAYADLVYGPQGICIQPYVHPGVEDVVSLLSGLASGIPRRAGRPVYIIIRSYQGWLEAALEDLNVEVGPRQALMVKHLAIAQRATQVLRLPNLENGRAEPSAPIIRVDRK